jgi:adenosylhomocysteine nucleosidase
MTRANLYDTANNGVISTGTGPVTVTGSALGQGTSVINSAGTAPAHARTAKRSSWDVGVITILTEEARAVTAVLASAGPCLTRTDPAGLRFTETRADSLSRPVNIVATQALDRGQRAAVIAFDQLRQHYAPTVVVLVGIAGGISPAVRLGDVIVVQEVIYYDLRKETASGVSHRGQGRPVPANIRHAINSFFSDHGEPYRATISDPAGRPRTCQVLPGPIGSGEAVIADQHSSIRQYLTTVNDKTMALETEAGGIAEAFYAMADASPGSGWLVIRGISDHADADKDDTYRDIAARHAAVTFQQLLPYLIPGEDSHR